MPITLMKTRRPSCILPSIVLLTMAGCALAPDDDQGLALVIKEHYAANATEEEGACRNPKIDSIQEHRLLETTADGDDVMMVRYSYFDRHADMDANWDRLVYLSQPCGGIAERRFMLEHGELGFRVTGMGGEHRNGESKH